MVNSHRAETRSAELAITSLISNKRKWNNCFIKFLKLQKFGSTFEIRAKKARKSERNRKNLMKMRCCVTPGGQTDAGL